MNTLAHISALGATLWLSVFCFATLSNQVMGTAFIVMFFFMMVATVRAVADDIEGFKDR